MTEIKKIFFDLGADLCGIASVDRFADAPTGFHPRDVLPGCRSVISFACRFPAATLKCTSPHPYTLVRNVLTDKMNRIAVSACVELEKMGIAAVPVPTNDSILDEKNRTFPLHRFPEARSAGGGAGYHRPAYPADHPRVRRHGLAGVRADGGGAGVGPAEEYSVQ